MAGDKPCECCEPSECTWVIEDDEASAGKRQRHFYLRKKNCTKNLTKLGHLLQNRNQ